MFLAVYGAVLFAALAMMVREGLWSNTISLLNIIFCGLVAFGFYSPLVVWLDEMTNGQNTYWLDFVCLWLLFIVAMVISRLVTGAASRTRMRFKNPLDPVGGPLAALIAAWVLAAFVTATLHTSPMPKDAFGGKLVHSDSEVASSMALLNPDLGWLRFVEKVSAATSLGPPSGGQFTARGFVRIYEAHRAKFEDADGLRVTRR